MHSSQLRREPFLEADRHIADALMEINELRRARCLPEYPPRTTTFRVLPRRPGHRLRARAARDR